MLAVNCKKIKNSIDKLRFYMLILILSLGNTMWYAEVVELVYGTSLENWRALIAYRGFESHPLRHLFFITIKFMEAYPSGWRGLFAKQLGFVRAAEVQILSLPPRRYKAKYSLISFLYYMKELTKLECLLI